MAATVSVPVALAVYDLANGFAAWRKVTQAAQAVGEISTALAANVDNSNSLSFAQADVATTAIFAYLPALRTASPAEYGVALSSVLFQPATSGCAQAGASANSLCARLAWSRNFQGNLPVARPCAASADQYTLAPVDDAAGSTTAGQVPAGAYTPAPMLVVDVAYTFRPLTLKFIQQAFVMRRSAYFPTRTGTNAQWVRYADPAGQAARCPGYA